MSRTLEAHTQRLLLPAEVDDHLREDAAATACATPAAVPVTPGPATTATATCAASFGVATGLRAVGTDLAAELTKLHALHLSGALSTGEFASAKRLLLGL